MGKALEVGAGTGRAAFELSKSFDHVHGGDYSQTFVDVAQALMNGEEQKGTMWNDRTAGTVVEKSIAAKELGIGNVSFSWQDAHDLPDEQFDLICAFNLVDRIQKPGHFLRSIRHRLNEGGVLVLSSPYTLLEQFTAKDEWLGGYKYGDNDSPTMYNGIKELLLAEGSE